MKARKKAEQWLSAQCMDSVSKNIIKEMLADDSYALTESFGSDLDFGTGGLRGLNGLSTFV